MTRQFDADRDAALLAAYLDGGLDAETRAEVEALLAEDPEALEVLVNARAALDAPAEDAPAAAIKRAQNIVRAPGKAPTRTPASSRAGGFFGLLRPAALTGALAAAFLLVAVGGFEAGRIGTNSAEAYQALTSEVLLPDPSGGLAGG